VPDAESVLVGVGEGVGEGMRDFAGLLVALGMLAVLGELVAVAELLAIPDFVASGEDVVARAEPVDAGSAVLALAEGLALFVVPAELAAALPVCFASPLPLGVALTLRVLPPLALAGVGDVDGAAFVGVVVGVGVSVGDVDVPPVDEPDVGEEVGVGEGLLLVGVGEGLLLVGVGVGDLDGLGVDDELGWDFNSSHCWLAPVTTDAMLADTVAEALDVPGWPAEATRE
jgi:hypothetical protein